ncbi:MAG: magnesium and cobalt transport protein CorA [Caldilineae bacterium]|nr:MAG: magnesium and cobalt transport protein CorA [Caldilineae bacterium]
MSIEVINYGRLVWVNCIAPTSEDMAYLRERFGFHPLDLEDCLSTIERPKIDEYDDYMFIVMHFPRYHSARKVTRPSEVDFFIGPNFFVTVHDGALKPMQRIWQACRESSEERQYWMGKGAGRLLYNILDRMVDYVFPMLNKIGGKISRIEENMFTQDMPDILQEISLLRRDIIALRRVMRPQLSILHNLERKERPYLQEDLDVYFGDVADAFARAGDIADEYHEVIEGLSATADSVTSYRINEIMRILTVISVIMLPLTLISGIYGMNIDLPLDEHPYSFFYVMALMLLVSISMLIYFRHRRWL